MVQVKVLCSSILTLSLTIQCHINNNDRKRIQQLLDNKNSLVETMSFSMKNWYLKIRLDGNLLIRNTNFSRVGYDRDEREVGFQTSICIVSNRKSRHWNLNNMYEIKYDVK